MRGALLVVDATQGVEAQTVANAFAAMKQNLKIIPVMNKMDLPSARPEDAAEEMEQVLGIARWTACRSRPRRGRASRNC